MKIIIPELSLVVLIGPSGSGKSTFARKHFKSTEVISSDFCRGLVADDENDQRVTKSAFEVLHFIASKRLEGGRLTVIDATNVQPEARKPLIDLARQHHFLPVAIVINLPEKVCHERNSRRPDRDFGPHVVRQQSLQLRRSLRGLEREGFRHVYVMSSEEEISEACIERQPLWNNLKHECGPFDIIGDVHGCFDELSSLLEELGYQIEQVDAAEDYGYKISHPEGRKAVFLGDLVDRGPNIPGVLKLVMSMVKSGVALCVPGNHDIKLLRKLKGKNVQVTHGLEQTLAQIEKEPPEFISETASFIDGLVSHYVLDGGKLVVAHAGMKEEMQGRGSGKVREFALFGETTGETDEFGLPIRHNWASEYRGRAMVVYGHTPVAEAEWINNTINIDTGCVFGGKLTALRYPEKELVEVPALYTYYEPARPFLDIEDQAPSAQEKRKRDDILDIDDVLGKRIISTRLYHNITIREENAVAAMEVMSRFAADPRWLIYLPPTMSPSETTKEPGLLEHPWEAFTYFRGRGVPAVVCEEKHMGSRAVVIVCRDRAVAERRFGIDDEAAGICYTRTGRHFFEDRFLEAELVDRVRKALDKARFWEELDTDWVCLDCELMPWSAKAQVLLKEQYSAVGIAGRTALAGAVAALEKAAGRNLRPFEVSGETSGQSADIHYLLNRFRERSGMLDKYVDAYRRYCWPVKSLNDIKLAPFHILATEGAVHSNRNHVWHMESIASICCVGDSLLTPTNYMVVDVTDPLSQERGVQWWEDLTSSGGEGMVVKPYDFIVKNRSELVQPAVKCRGKEYLRIIYGPEYLIDENLKRLRKRSLGKKRSLALREFTLGMEALDRFVRKEPLYRVHECVFGVLALESEPVDPRL
ncbi:MAG: polynucleotide kinase-phosphatase [Peptococcaceae bacterium]|nr:polynucleotide kinase-phosphatase [Peptococcaceae bacterium]